MTCSKTFRRRSRAKTNSPSISLGAGADEDTIVAIATAAGEAAIGIVRVSGPDAHRVLRRLFRITSKHPAPDEFEPFRAYHGTLHHPQTGELTDEVIVTTYLAPRSYTGEDLVEISAHGGRVVLRSIVEACLAANSPTHQLTNSPVRLAEPGEFTLRAFLNGKMDLAQAEAVADLICAKSKLSARAALEQLQGTVGDAIRELQNNLVRLMTHLEASLDFPDDELEPWTPQEQLRAAEAANQTIRILIESYERGRVLREGLTVTIAGKPNVGKSSLLNALLRHERAIVTPIPGTTRDTLEEPINIKGLPVKAIDTAGIRADPDEVERIGIGRAKRAIEEADVVLVVLDASEPLTEEDNNTLSLAEKKRMILVRNKTDLPSAWDERVLAGRASSPDIVATSALTGAGIVELEDAIHSLALDDGSASDHEPIITSLRHKQALERSDESLRRAIEAMQQQLPADIVSIPLRDSLNALGEITGDNLVETAIHNIFAEFCIGK